MSSNRGQKSLNIKSSGKDILNWRIISMDDEFFEEEDEEDDDLLDTSFLEED